MALSDLPALRRGKASLAEIQGQVASRIMQLTDNGDQVLHFYYNVMRDETINIKYRLVAAEWLANRMWGKEPEVIHLNTGGIFEGLIKASDEELLALVKGEFDGLPLLKAVDENHDAEG